MTISWRSEVSYHVEDIRRKAAVVVRLIRENHFAMVTVVGLKGNVFSKIGKQKETLSYLVVIIKQRHVQHVERHGTFVMVSALGAKINADTIKEKGAS